jgi:hypothetical protein
MFFTQIFTTVMMMTMVASAAAITSDEHNVGQLTTLASNATILTT